MTQRWDVPSLNSLPFCILFQGPLNAFLGSGGPVFLVLGRSDSFSLKPFSLETGGRHEKEAESVGVREVHGHGVWAVETFLSSGWCKRVAMLFPAAGRGDGAQSRRFFFGSSCFCSSLFLFLLVYFVSSYFFSSSASWEGVLKRRPRGSLKGKSSLKGK